MKRIIVAGLSLVFLLAGLTPASVAQQSASYSGKGSARALDLSIPALNAFPELAGAFKGLTLGHTAAEFDSSPRAQGFASGDCELLAQAAGFETLLGTGLPCTKGTVEDSVTPSKLGDGNPSCVFDQSIYVVALRTSCGNSSSRIEGGKPVSLNDAGVSAANVSVDLNALGPPFGAYLEGNKDAVVDILEGVFTLVFDIASQEQLNELEEALGDFLESVKQGGQFAAVTVGDASTDVTSQGDLITITSSASGGRVGLLGLTNALSDGLIMIEVSSGSATASLDRLKATTSADATAALAKVRFRNVIDLSGVAPELACSGDYCEVTVGPLEVNNLLSPLNGTILETTVDVAKTTKTANSASSTGVGIRALKGIGQKTAGATPLACGSCDGGLSLRLAAADVSVSVVLRVTIQQPLPVTGGPTYLYWAAAAVLAIGAPLLIRVARRLRTTA